jgi:protein SCO1/2
MPDNFPPGLTASAVMPELQFSKLVDELKTSPVLCERLTDLLHEDHPIYDQRGAAAITRMRGWVLLALGKRLSERALPFFFEELDNGRDAYLVAAAARVLRTGAQPAAAIAPFLMRALANIQFHDDFVSLDRYGGYASSPGSTAEFTTAVDELVATLRWLGSHAKPALPAIETLLADNAKGGGALSKTQLGELRIILASARASETVPEPSLDCCTPPFVITAFREWLPRLRTDEIGIGPVVFEDQDGKRIAFSEFFHGQPSVIAFFYSRCTNPFKCSLTVAKLARLQKLLIDRRMDRRIRTAAITYDPAFDLANRLRGYGASRGLRMDSGNRLLRPVEGIEPVRKYFRLGVNFIGSLINRHRVEVYVLDARGNITASFERIQWDENEVLDCAIALLSGERGNTAPAAAESNECKYSNPVPNPVPNPVNKEVAKSLALMAGYGRSSAGHPDPGSALSAALPILALTAALFPKCPVCWAAYLSVFGIASVEWLPYSPWLLPLLAALMLVNLASLWLQYRAQQRMPGFYLAAAGAFMILVPGMGLELEYANLAGVLLTLSGSLLGVFSPSGNLDRRARSSGA